MMRMEIIIGGEGEGEKHRYFQKALREYSH